MDSVTQAILGAAVGHVVVGRRIGWKAAALGALGGTAPDLDVFLVPDGRSVLEWVHHRGITHSLFFGPVVGTVAGLISARLHRRWAKEAGAPASRWVAFWVLVLTTHPLLDLMTHYGTQLLAPFSSVRFGVPAVPIIDPLYTLVLLAGLALAGRLGMRTARARAVVAGGLVLSTAYLFVGWTQQPRALELARADLAAKGVAAQNVQAYTTMFTPWLRRLVAEVDGHYRVGFVSTLAPRPIRWNEVSVDPAARALLDAAKATPEGRIYFRFATGPVHPVRVDDGRGGQELRLADMRFGFPGATLTGFWGLALPVADGRVAGEGFRFTVPREVSRSSVYDLLSATFGQPTTLF